MNKLAYYSGYMEKEAGYPTGKAVQYLSNRRLGKKEKLAEALEKEARRSCRFERMLASGDLPEDYSPHLGMPRVAQFESAMQKAWLKGVAKLKNSDTPTV